MPINDSTEEIFNTIYERNLWGKSEDSTIKFYSGDGSHDPTIVSPYVNVVSTFLLFYRLISNKPANVVDLGCGDFAVGSKIRHLCDRYVACDIVAPLIEHNKVKFQSLNVEFKTLDLATYDLPNGDIVFVRQVFQHLTNDQIKNALINIQSTYKYLVLTEHIPSAHNFTANIEIPNIGDWRMSLNSGVVVTDPPFNLEYVERINLCQARQYGGIISTILYKLAH